MKASLLALLMLTTLPTSWAQAEIGWTLDECKQHYGKEIKVEPPYDGHSLATYTFAGNNGYLIIVYFIADKVSRILYVKVDHTLFSSATVFILRAINAPADTNWELQQKDEAGTRWAGTKTGSTTPSFWATEISILDHDTLSIFTAEDADVVRKHTQQQ
jgi:hypothetical protein